MTPAERFKEQLAVVIDALQAHPSRILAFWHSPEARWQQYCSLRSLNLVIAYEAPGGKGPGYKAESVTGTVTRDCNGVQKILFDNQCLIRIKGGQRNNLVVTPERLYLEEQGVPAGLNKQLTIDPRPSALFMDRKGDAQFLTLLADKLDTAKTSAEKRPFLPKLRYFIRTADDSGIRPRLTGALAARLQEEADYDPALALADNWEHMKSRFLQSDPTAPGQKLYPFEYVEGKGGVYADVDAQPGLYALPAEAMRFEDPSFRLEVRL